MTTEQWYEWPEWAKDALVCDTDVTLSWRDRLRVLIGRRITVTTKTFTQAQIGRNETLSRACVTPLWRRRPVGMVTSEVVKRPETP